MLSNLKISKPSIFLGAFLFIAQIISGFHAAHIHETSAIFNTWYYLAFYWAIIWWFINDTQLNKGKWGNDYMDIGMFLYIAWMFVIPYYLFKTYGRKAFYTIFFLLSIYVGAYIAGIIIYLIVSGKIIS